MIFLLNPLSIKLVQDWYNNIFKTSFFLKLWFFVPWNKIKVLKAGLFLFDLMSVVPFEDIHLLIDLISFSVLISPHYDPLWKLNNTGGSRRLKVAPFPMKLIKQKQLKIIVLNTDRRWPECTCLRSCITFRSKSTWIIISAALYFQICFFTKKFCVHWLSKEAGWCQVRKIFYLAAATCYLIWNQNWLIQVL